VFLCAGVWACSSSSSSSGGGSSGAPPDPCAPSAGTYTIHTTKDPSSSAGCPDVPDQDVTLDPNNLFGGVRDDDAGPGCTVTHDSKACTITIHCDDVEDGFDSTTDQSIATMPTSYSGKSESRTTGDGGLNVDCKYSFQATKK
jgi:hypothetical protein